MAVLGSHRTQTLSHRVRMTNMTGAFKHRRQAATATAALETLDLP